MNGNGYTFCQLSVKRDFVLNDQFPGKKTAWADFTSVTSDKSTTAKPYYPSRMKVHMRDYWKKLSNTIPTAGRVGHGWTMHGE
jgi:hypothetical protein